MKRNRQDAPRPITAVRDEPPGLRGLIAPLAMQEGALLPILHAVQAAYGCVSDVAVPVIADVLNLSRAEVHGVVTFYHDYKRVPQGAHVVRLCAAEACQSRGGRALAAQAEARLGIDAHGTTADGRVTLEPVYCLGLCSVGPSAMIDGRIVARLDAARLGALLDGVAA